MSPARPADGEREVPVLAADLPAEGSTRRRLYPHLDAQLADDVTPVSGHLVRRHRRSVPRPRAGIPGIKVRSCGICGRVVVSPSGAYAIGQRSGSAVPPQAIGPVRPGTTPRERARDPSPGTHMGKPAIPRLVFRPGPPGQAAPQAAA